MLALDVGLKRIGVAIYIEGIILPLAPVIRRNRTQAASEIKALIEEKKPEFLVIGLPSDEGMQRGIRHFVNLLEFKGKVHFINEDLSSKEACELLLDRAHKERSNARKDGKLDSLAASLILQRFIDTNAR
ncbi:Holliday junction resolvase RuvX [Helicobacter sp. 11S02629-2]|uniref:Holliday junction resolvase RuvX n=1 Tax=Helicobacter sp. 11S02629-2 TaxID=1476195 RepID=UPI000BC4E633|nr:Holliday junction resolvase RuvX [Helicobacter sp. 11S02629-2]PAF43518.1 hypothetical protein BKH40_07000 [Helicobacter sp. 11S02629-2]